jgi:hypothetical protein
MDPGSGMIKQRGLQPFEFVQRVPDAGFEWVHIPGMRVGMAAAGIEATRSDWFLRERRVPPFRGTAYRPLITQTGLFRIFAEVEPTRAGIQAFANAFGPLGWSSGESITVALDRPPSYEMMRIDSQSLRTWKSEILRMRALVQIWDATRAGDTTILSRVIEWKNDGAVIYHGLGEKGFRVVASPALNPETLGGFEPGDVIEPARIALGQITNDLLTKHRTTPRLVPNHGNGQQLCHVPESLNAALWLQFAVAQASGYEFKRCANCGVWFQVGTAAEARRADATYCSNRCRQKTYRDRKEVRSDPL